MKKLINDIGVKKKISKRKSKERKLKKLELR
jgi:hypothetical protein